MFVTEKSLATQKVGRLFFNVECSHFQVEAGNPACLIRCIYLL